MARFIDADELYRKLYPLDLADKRTYTINAKAVADAIANIPTADVVPKSEVDVWKQDRFNLYQRLELYEITRQKVSREIFEEIERSTINSNFEFMFVSKKYFAELKKKYTEEV